MLLILQQCCHLIPRTAGVITMCLQSPAQPDTRRMWTALSPDLGTGRRCHAVPVLTSHSLIHPHKALLLPPHDSPDCDLLLTFPECSLVHDCFVNIYLLDKVLSARDCFSVRFILFCLCPERKLSLCEHQYYHAYICSLALR